MRPVLAALMAVAALALSGCYESKRLLLDPAQAVLPLALGRQVPAGDDPPTAVLISLDPSPWYRMDDADKPPAPGEKIDHFLFVPLPQARGLMAFAFGSPGLFTYGIAERRNGRVYLDYPSCQSGPARVAALAHGVKAPTKDATQACEFASARSLLGALADYAKRRDPKAELPSLPAAP